MFSEPEKLSKADVRGLPRKYLGIQSYFTTNKLHFLYTNLSFSGLEVSFWVCVISSSLNSSFTSFARETEMAGALVGGAFLSASLQVLFDRLASREVVSFIRGQKLSDVLLKKLERKLLVVHAVLNDAEVKQFTNPYVKKWLVLLKEVVYDAEDILDEIATEALRHKVEAAESQTSTSQVGNIMDMSTWVLAPFDDESLVYGRDQIKEKMVQLLLSDNARSTDAMGLVLLWMAEGLTWHNCCLNQMEKLINLRYLDIIGTGVKEMPSDICKLKNLQSLSTFIVGQNGGLSLGALRELSGSLVLSKLENVACDEDALEANMKDKKYLDELKFEWDNENTDVGVVQNRRDILSSLQPHTNVKRLHINSFSGLSFPVWVGDPSFFNLVDLGLQNCNNCSSLPPLGQLPSLKHLSILQMKGVKMVGSEFYGNKLCINECPKLIGKLPKQLRSLKKLEIIDCELLLGSLRAPRIREWKMSECDSIEWVLEEGMLQRSTCLLQHLHITSYLTIHSLNVYPFLICRKLKLLAHTHSSLQELRLIDCPELLFQRDGLPSDLRDLEISSCNQLTSQVDWGLQRLASLTIFTINDGCRDMESFPNESLLPSTLTSLYISNLPNLKSLDSNGLRHLTSLSTLYISKCPKFQSFGEEGLQHLTSLENLQMYSLPMLESLREVGLQHLTSLKALSISRYHNLQYLTNERLPNSLSFLEIQSCPLSCAILVTNEGGDSTYIKTWCFFSPYFSRDRLVPQIQNLCLLNVFLYLPMIMWIFKYFLPYKAGT
ncbi:unnamed protein product, partial [Vitis vinifera]